MKNRVTLTATFDVDYDPTAEEVVAMRDAMRSAIWLSTRPRLSMAGRTPAVPTGDHVVLGCEVRVDAIEETR